MADCKELETWKAITAEETRLRGLVTARPICEASYQDIQKDPRRQSTVLAERLQALFLLTGTPPDSAGYRRLLFAVLSDESLASKMSGLRRPKMRAKASSAVTGQPPRHMVSSLRAVASLTAQGLSREAAIRHAVEEQNSIVEHLDRCDPLSSPRKRITIHSLRKEEQRTRQQAKCLPDAVEDALDAELDERCFAAALEASAPRSDRWVDELSNLLGAHRQGKVDRLACRRRMMAALDAELDRCAMEAPTAG